MNIMFILTQYSITYSLNDKADEQTPLQHNVSYEHCIWCILSHLFAFNLFYLGI